MRTMIFLLLWGMSFMSLGQSKYDCKKPLEHPYYLIQFENGKYGVMKITYGQFKWFMLSDTRYHDFDDRISKNTFMSDDSCSAKVAIRFILSTKEIYQQEPKYRIVK